MKNLIFLSLVLLFSSCSTLYYQVYTVKSDNVKEQGNALVYENDDCRIIYNLWRDGGRPGFIFFNKTDKNIFIDLKKCSFIKNHKAYDYFLNRSSTFNSSSTLSQADEIAYGSSSLKFSEYFNADKYTFINSIYIPGIISSSMANTHSNAITHSEAVKKRKSASYSFSEGILYKEKDIICIPPKSFKEINEYIISKDVIIDCGKMSPRKIPYKFTFDELNTPLKFSNVICYFTDKDNEHIINNDFYVESIENHSEESAIKKEKYDEECTESDKHIYYKYFFTVSGPNKFYIPYSPDKL
ncbi:hypothetical protein [Coprobacter sp.]|uniref:hypothetical protein n=1 Tax=Coprobacter sp. TaxID=1941478 RepID=UPI003AB7BD47